MMHRELKERVWRRDGVKCRYCGKQLRIPPRGVSSHGSDTATVDHVLAKRDGGKASFNNLITACGPCNKAKGHLSALDFRMKLYAMEKQA